MVMSGPTTITKPFQWSYSQLKNAETCLKRYYHYQVAKDVTEPESQQLRDGNQLHAHFDKRIRLGVALPLGYGQYENMLAKILAAPGDTYSEQKLAFTKELQPCPWFAPDVWFRGVLDAAKVRENGTASLFDWKTGKPSPDTTQLQLSAATMFIHMPGLQRVRTALVFVGYNQVETAEYTRGDQAEIWSEILPRVRALEQAKAKNDFPPKPSGLCRKYCGVTVCAYHGRGMR